MAMDKLKVGTVGTTASINSSSSSSVGTMTWYRTEKGYWVGGEMDLSRRQLVPKHSNGSICQSRRITAIRNCQQCNTFFAEVYIKPNYSQLTFSAIQCKTPTRKTKTQKAQLPGSVVLPPAGSQVLFISVYWHKLIVCWDTVWMCCLNKKQTILTMNMAYAADTA